MQTGSSSPDFTVAMAAAGLAKPQRFHPQKYVWERGGLKEEGLVGRITGKGSNTNAARSWGTSGGPLSEDVLQAGASLQEVLGRIRDSSPTGSSQSIPLALTWGLWVTLTSVVHSKASSRRTEAHVREEDLWW